jgi:CBS domain-containing protein
MKVAEVMTRAPETLSPKATLAEAARKILETRYGGFPVVDEKGRLVGLLQVEELLPRPENVPFSDVEATTEVRHLPVVDQEDKVVGILTRSDILKLILGRQ